MIDNYLISLLRATGTGTAAAAETDLRQREEEIFPLQFTSLVSDGKKKKNAIFATFEEVSLIEKTFQIQLAYGKVGCIICIATANTCEREI